MKLTLTFALVAVSSAALVGKQQNFLGNGMQPEVVARTLSSVEEEWKAQAAVFAECNGTSFSTKCADAPSSFDKSCSTVVRAIIQGSGGDKAVAKEYMSDVCSQKSISGWHQEQCNALSLAVQSSMTADKYENRENFNAGKLCSSFWGSFLEKEKVRVQKEQADREAAEKKAAEEAGIHQEELKKEAEAEEAAAKEAAAKEAERQKVEEQKRVELEAKVKAAESAARLAQKKAEAEEVAVAAQKKKEEAEAEEKEQMQAMANLTAVSKTAPVEASKETVAPASSNATVVEQKVEVKAPAENKTAVKVDIVSGSNSTAAAVNTSK